MTQTNTGSCNRSRNRMWDHLKQYSLWGCKVCWTHHTVPYAPVPTCLRSRYLSGTSHTVLFTSCRQKPVLVRTAIASRHLPTGDRRGWGDHVKRFRWNKKGAARRGARTSRRSSWSPVRVAGSSPPPPSLTPCPPPPPTTQTRTLLVTRTSRSPGAAYGCVYNVYKNATTHLPILTPAAPPPSPSSTPPFPHCLVRSGVRFAPIICH